MSNASNLSTLAGVLDDGSAGEFLKSTGSGGVAFDTVAAGAVVYATADLLPLSGFAAGDMAYVTATNRFYINNGSGWYSISLVNTNPSITSVQDASSGTTPFTLATDGSTATVVTITAADPEDVPLTYGYSVTSGSLNGSTVTQGTGSNTNVFTVTPHSSQDATFTLTFTASDGINQATSANAFSLSFVTVVADSNHTTLLATATGTSDNNNITDSSSSPSSITVNGDAHAGTFSPYRSGGYSMNFNNNGTTSQIKFSENTNFNMSTNAFTIEGWLRPYNTSSGTRRFYQNRYTSTGNGRGSIYQNGSNLYMSYRGDNGTDYELGPYSVLSENTWTHFCLLRNTSDNTLKLYADGTLLGDVSVPSSVGIYNSSSNTYVGVGFRGDMANLRVINGTAIPPTSSSIAEKPQNVTNTVLLLNAGSITNYSSISMPYEAVNLPTIKTYGPLDYTEYSATDHGGSVYFDGNQDYILGNSGTNLGTANWTVEGWMYITDTTSDRMFIDFRPFTNGDYVTLKFESSDSKMYFISGNSNKIASNDLITANSWVFISLVRDSGTIKMYINGKVQTQTYASTANYLSHSARPIIGINGDNASSDDMYGYISDVRVTIGTAHYTADFTPPTAPLSSSGAELHIKGTDASIIDKSQVSNLKLVGNTTGSTTQAKFSNTKSMYFDGTGDRATVEGIQDLGDDFTIECWLYSTTTGNRTIVASIDNLQPFNGDGYWAFYIGGGNYPQLQIDGGTTTPNNATLPTNQWVHLATTRTSNTVRYFINGTVQSTTFSNSLTLKNPSGVVIGSGPNNGYIYNYTGYIQDLRITNECKYTTSFSVPTAPLEG